MPQRRSEDKGSKSKHRSSSRRHKSSSSSSRHRSSRHRSKYSDDSGASDASSDSSDADSDDRGARKRSRRHSSSKHRKSASSRHGRKRDLSPLSEGREDDDDKDGARRKRRHSSSAAPSSSKVVRRDDAPAAVDEGDEEWVEKSPEIDLDIGSGDELEVGPLPAGMTSKQAGRNAYGGALRPGEGSAMAAYVSSDQRIPRRGEIGMESEQIERFEQAGYVMSGSRHRRMNAVRVRKENQVISAEEKRGILQLAAQEKVKRENEVCRRLVPLVIETCELNLGFAALSTDCRFVPRTGRSKTVAKVVRLLGGFSSRALTKKQNKHYTLKKGLSRDFEVLRQLRLRV